MATTDLWTFRDTTWRGRALVGFTVEGTDGEIGKIDDATDDAAGSGLVVDTGSWIFGRKVLIPAGIVETVDLDAERVFVNRTKEEIKNAPEYDDALRDDVSYRGDVAGYYSRDVE